MSRFRRSVIGLVAVALLHMTCAAMAATAPGDDLPGLDGNKATESETSRRGSRLRFGGGGPVCMCSGDGLSEESIRAAQRKGQRADDTDDGVRRED